jgi:hypothetical protein
MNIFYGGAIQGSVDRKLGAQIHQYIISILKSLGCDIFTEHTTGNSYEEAIEKLEQSIGPLPEKGLARRIYVRNKMIAAIESDIDACIFEVSTPSLGTGIEIAHAYLRPRMGLLPIPVITLYQKDFWPNKLSTMIQGITKVENPYFTLIEYRQREDLQPLLKNMLKSL